VSRLSRPLTVLSLLAALVPAPLQAQEAVTSPSDPIIIAPQATHVVIMPHHRPPGPPIVLPVKVASVNTQVSIDDQMASTTLVMTLQNPGGGAREAQVVVPVPDGASIRSFGIDGMGTEPTAKLLPKDEARRIYETIVRRSRDPGLLEFVGYSVIRTSVFPVPAGGTQTVRLTYESLLPAERGAGASSADRVDYVLPRSESVSGEDGSGTTWSLSVDLKAKRPISTVYSPSHEVSTERIDEKHVRVKTLPSAASAPGSFRLSYLLSAEREGLTATVLAYPDPELSATGGGYFMLLAGLPPADPSDASKQAKREVTVVIDRSGSMRNDNKMSQAREAALQVLEGLRDGERFNVIDFSDSISSFEGHPVAKSDATMKKARSYIKGIEANGGTNIHDALLEALRQEPAEGMLPVVLFLTDGMPTVGTTSEAAIREAAKAGNTAHRRIFTFGVGYDVNAPLLTGLARGSRGASTFVLPGEDVEVKVGQVYRRLSGPIMALPKVAAVNGEEKAGGRLRELQPRELPDLFDGDQLVVLGQYTGKDPVTIQVSGDYLQKARSFEVSFDPGKATVRNSFVGRLWAARKIGSLLEEIRLASADARPSTDNPRTKELVDEVVRLSMKWGIMTEYTAFLAVEAGSDLARRDEALYAPVAPSAAPAKAAANVSERAVKVRLGKEAVNQDQNLSYQTGATNVQMQREFLDKDMNRVKLAGVQQVQDRALFKRNDRWVDGRLLEKEAEAPEQTIEFASAEYFQLADELAAQNRQGILAQQGDVYLLHNGKRVLVRGGE
jgi:Ca-activated chloride channel family protein